MFRERPAETDQERIEDLIHIYIDGAFDRRELLKRIARYTGSVAALRGFLRPPLRIAARHAGTDVSDVRVTVAALYERRFFCE